MLLLQRPVAADVSRLTCLRRWSGLTSAATSFKKSLLTGGLALVALTSSHAAELPIAKGPFQPTMESLTNFVCPEWFRDAKFGIWAHWGPQAVPMAGDWYAKHTYVQGHGQYKHHLQNYGHPFTNGWKDIIPLWRAEKWEPDRLMALYKKAGAKYFVSMGVHHDNFDLWNSKHHRWNAVNMGPRRDVVGEWQRAAKKQGLRFGVSEHLGASYTWFQTSHGADATGPLAGVPYDGTDPKYEDLYHPKAAPDDKGWYSTNPQWHQEWFSRIQDLVDSYKPDLLYTDGGIPFGETGRGLVAHFYNADLQRHRRLEAVYTCKKIGSGEFVTGTCVQDMERGVLPGINPYPWQTDTSIGDWFYNSNWKFRPVSWTIHMLVDIVSKNGNLLLNIVQRPDGSLDPEVVESLEQLAAWMKVNGDAIYGTRPWQVYGEGPVRSKGGHFKEDFAYTARDIRFTTKGKTLYAFALGGPDDGKLIIKSLAKPVDGKGNRINRVTLLGHKGKLRFEQTGEALVVQLPSTKLSDIACALKISGRDFTAVPVPETTAIVQPDAKGNFTLVAEDAELHGEQITTEERGGRTNIGFWDKADEWVSWKVRFPASGDFDVTASCAGANGEAEFVVEVIGQQLTAKSANTGSWDKFDTVKVGRVAIPQAGEQTIAIRPRDAATWKAMNLRSLKLVRVP